MELYGGESVRETERFAVTAAAGALGPVLKKLSSLLGAEYRLQEGTRRDIQSVKSDLEPVHDLLGKLWGRLDLDDEVCKDWVTEARELSYDMEDGIDSFTEGLERGGDGTFIQKEGTVTCPVKDFLQRVKDVSKRCGEMQKTADTICNRSSMLTTDPRALFLHKDLSELVGMDENREELIKLLQEHEMVCIVGPAGMGKTTLADLVYQKIGDQFQCRAFVSLHPNPNMTEILGTIHSQVTDGAVSDGSGTEAATEQNIVNDISISLSGKRYLVIIDDIWHWKQWGVIREALPKNNLGCKFIMTTRVAGIAEKCESEQGAGVFAQKFGRGDAERLSAMRLSKSAGGTNVHMLSTKIADMCGVPPFYCCPLAVICLSSAWADSHHVEEERDKWASRIQNDGFLSTPSLQPLVESLCIGLDDLPLQLRTCLLYCTVYPLGCWIDRGCLMRKWIAEGFVSHIEVAEVYFNKLVSRNLLQLHLRMNTTVHPFMQAFLVCKAKEDDFIAYDGAGGSSRAKQLRRLSLSTDRYQDEDVLSRIRSLVVFGQQCQLYGVPFKAFKKLRVLEINSSRLQNGHLVDICGLIWLKYLDLIGCLQITELPREIGRLQNLETLNVAGTQISQLPTEIGKLRRLETLDLSDTTVTELPRDIKNLERLETLDISWTRVRELPKEIRKLQRLRNLNVRGTKVRELPWDVQNSINVHVSGLHSVKTVKLAEAVSPDRVISSSSPGAHCRRALSIVFFDPFNARCEEPLQVPLLRVAGRYMKVPQWVKQDLRNVCSLDIRLFKLGEDDLEFLKQMRNLQAIALRFEVLPWKPIAITGGGFSKLETLYVDCRLPRVITFEKEAMPKLKLLEFKFYAATARQDYSMGIKHLDSLENIMFRCSEYYTSDGPGIRETIEVVRKEAAEHPNKIILWVDDQEPEAFGRGATWISQADKAIIQKEIEELEKQTDNRIREIEEKAERICEQRYRLLTAAQTRGALEKKNAWAVIQKEIQEKKSILEKKEQYQRQAAERRCTGRQRF